MVEIAGGIILAVVLWHVGLFVLGVALLTLGQLAGEVHAQWTRVRDWINSHPWQGSPPRQ